MPLQLLLVRHGESEANAGTSSDPDCPLSPRGFEQARELAARLAAADLSGFTAITSPYRRARQTADIIAAATGMRFAVDEDIREWAQDATVAGRFYPREDPEQLIERLRHFLARYGGRKLLVVSHAAPIGALMHIACGETLDTRSPFWDGIENCCLRQLTSMGSV